MGKYFGTDGVRGVANVELTTEMAAAIGRALAFSLTETIGRRPKICIGRDTRISGSMLECALAAGICACGGDVYLLGVMPTPAVAYLAQEEKMDAGVVISASHNPFEHNGIKIFGGSGYKLDDEQEAEIEQLMDDLPPEALVSGADIGRVTDCTSEGNSRYSRHIVECAGGDLRGMRVRGFDLGAAFDGDADRCLMCDENGRIIDGDDIIALLAADMHKKGTLTRGVVATIMSNMGLGAYLRPLGVDVAAVKVGDRHVLEEMRRSGSNIGGEQSGHVILSDYATTGDGQLTAVRFMRMLKESGKKASELRGGIFHYPQIVVNLEVPNHFKKSVPQLDAVKELEKEISDAFNGDGRINIRPSGTEALVRIMVEGKDAALVSELSEKAKKVVANAVRDLIVSSSDY